MHARTYIPDTWRREHLFSQDSKKFLTALGETVHELRHGVGLSSEAFLLGCQILHQLTVLGLKLIQLSLEVRLLLHRLHQQILEHAKLAVKSRIPSIRHLKLLCDILNLDLVVLLDQMFAICLILQKEKKGQYQYYSSSSTVHQVPWLESFWKGKLTEFATVDWSSIRTDRRDGFSGRVLITSALLPSTAAAVVAVVAPTDSGVGVATTRSA